MSNASELVCLPARPRCSQSLKPTSAPRTCARPARSSPASSVGLSRTDLAALNHWLRRNMLGLLFRLDTQIRLFVRGGG
jgi:hypothetical protein